MRKRELKLKEMIRQRDIHTQLKRERKKKEAADQKSYEY